MNTSKLSREGIAATLRSNAMAAATPRMGTLRRWNCRRSGVIASAAALALCVGLAGCSLPEAKPDLTRYYVLTPLAPAAEKPAVNGPRVLLRDVDVPEFLRGIIMQVRIAENELRFVDEARWAEPLDAGLQRVLREGLARDEGVGVVGRGGEPHDFEVAVQLRRCEGVLPEGVARLAASIEVFSTGIEATRVGGAEFSTDIPGWNGSDYGDLAKKLSEAAAQLSRRIAELVPEPPAN